MPKFCSEQTLRARAPGHVKSLRTFRAAMDPKPQNNGEVVMPVSMRSCTLALACLLAPALTQSANAQLLDQKSLSSAIAITMAQTAIETCKASGYRVSVSVVGRTGEVILQVRGDNASPHTVENSQRKAYTART